MNYRQNSSKKTDFFALYENANRDKKKLELNELFEVKDIITQSILFEKNPQTKQKIYTNEDELRRVQLKKTKEELHKLTTNQDTRVNHTRNSSYNKKREEFINIKKILQAEMSTKSYTRAS